MEVLTLALRFTVSVHCKDTKIAVQVRTNKPFNGRIYALGRSETCNIDVLNSDQFRLDLTMAGQDCNTQSVVSNVRTQICIGTYLHEPVHGPSITYETLNGFNATRFVRVRGKICSACRVFAKLDAEFIS